MKRGHDESFDWVDSDNVLEKAEEQIKSAEKLVLQVMEFDKGNGYSEKTIAHIIPRSKFDGLTQTLEACKAILRRGGRSASIRNLYERLGQSCMDVYPYLRQLKEGGDYWCSVNKTRMGAIR